MLHRPLALLAPVTLLVALSPQDVPNTGKPFFQKADTPLPANVYCTIDGFELTRAEYGDWLQRTRGDEYIQVFVMGKLVRNAADTLGIQVDPVEVEAMLERQIEERTIAAYRGNRAMFIEQELTNFGKTMEQFKREKLWNVETDLLVTKVLTAKRLTTDSDVEQEFRRLYGASGREFWLRAILLELQMPTITTRKSPEELQQITSRAVETTRAAGVEIVKRIQTGSLDFASAALAYSNDSLSKRKGGDIGQYIPTPPMFGEEFDALLHKAAPGQLIGPVRIQAGYVVAEITREVKHDLRAERDALRERLKQREPTPIERQQFLAEIFREAKLVR